MLLTRDQSNQTLAQIRATIDAALHDRRLSARRASLEVVGNDGLIRDIRSGAAVGVDRIAALCSYLGLEFYVGPPRHPPAAFETPEARSQGEARSLPWHGATGRRGLSPLALDPAWLAQQGLSFDALSVVQIDRSFTAMRPGALAAITLHARSSSKLTWAYRQKDRICVAEIEFLSHATVVSGAGPAGGTLVLIGDDRRDLDILGRVVWTGGALIKAER